MSVVVRMEMPKHCGECELQIWDIWPGSFKCAKTRTDIMSHMRNRTKPNDCPIICQLPDGHGRLADKDLLMLDLDFLNTFGTPDDGKELSYEDILVTIDDFPTIVPAEAERSET